MRSHLLVILRRSKFNVAQNMKIIFAKNETHYCVVCHIKLRIINKKRLGFFSGATLSMIIV